MLGPDEPDAHWRNAATSRGRGIQTDDGSLLVAEDGRITLLNADGNVLTASEPVQSYSEISFSANGGRIFGRGAGEEDAQQLTWYGNITPVVMNWWQKGSQSHVPHYYTTDGYAALGVTAGEFTTLNGSFLSATYHASPTQITWRNIREGPLDLYLMPAADLSAGTAAYYSLVGRPRMPPLWTFGFMASRWGWVDEAYVEDTLGHFRSGSYPADAFIADFEWYSNESDYEFPVQGKPYCNDFRFRETLFSEPQRQLARYRSDLHFRFGGIRKARLCNSESLAFARSRGWILPWGSSNGNAYYSQGRELNYSRGDVRAWYGEQMAHFTQDGVSFWWNDEAETQYFTFYWLNVAQSEAFYMHRPRERFWSINRNFAPGMARLGVGFWTGDSSPEWWNLAAQPGYVLNWALAGAPYVASDIGGFSSNTSTELLVRWYQVGVFMPIMRIHSVNWATPHWPWLWGADAAKAMKAALELRYRLIPYHYSLAMTMFLEGTLWMKPMAMAFPQDAVAENLTQQWMDGELLVAPVLRSDSVKQLYLPAGTWYPFQGGPRIVGPMGPMHSESPARLNEIPVFAPAGTIVLLAPVVQYTEALPGGALEVRIFPGSDATFRLFEDDGVSMEYWNGAYKVTRFSWNDVAQTLSWEVEGTHLAPTHFTELFLSVSDVRGFQKSRTVGISAAGSLAISTPDSTISS
jgi:alpha-glucosidase